MIEFNGRLSSAAEKRFWKKAADFGQGLLLVGTLPVFPFMIYLSLNVQTWLPIGAFLFWITFVMLMLRMPKSKKERMSTIPKKIYIEGHRIICVADKYVECRNISDVKHVRDFEEFYELVFPFGKASGKFICQKSLLTKGTATEFEALFKGRILRK